jgi:hypothetical protein
LSFLFLPIEMGDRRCDSEDVAEEIVLDDSVPQDFQEDDMDDDTMQDGGEETLEDFVDDSIQVCKMKA